MGARHVDGLQDFRERALKQNIWELIRPEVLETLAKFLHDANEYVLETEYLASIVPTGGTEA